MTLNLTKEQEEAVQAQLATGRFADATEVIGNALEALEERSAAESPALEAALLEGVREEHTRYGADTLERIRTEAQKAG